MKKILIVGSTGMLGRTAKKYFQDNGYNVSTLDRSDVDLSKTGWDGIRTKIIDNCCDILINCAGLIIQRKNTPIEDFLKVNSIIPRWMANICEEQGIEMYHPTTDCIYDGLEGPYEEGRSYTEKGIYGLSKVLGEPENCAVIRSSIIGEESHNKLSFLEWVRSNVNSTVNGYSNHLWNGVTCLEMCKIIHEIIESNSYYKGTKHYYSPIVTKADMIKYVNEVYDLNIKINVIDTGTIINKTLLSKYTKERKDLKEQIKEQKNFWVH